MFILVASILLVIAGLAADKLLLKLACITTGMYGVFMLFVGIANATAHSIRGIVS